MTAQSADWEANYQYARFITATILLIRCSNKHKKSKQNETPFSKLKNLISNRISAISSAVW